MSHLLQLRNRQRARRVNTPLLRAALLDWLANDLRANGWELCVHLVGPREMARLNWEFLRHEGPTDVITFDHLPVPDPDLLHGEIFICVAVAVEQSARFKTTWSTELLRYAIHGVLHLRGHDDHEPADRRRMKRAENRHLRNLSRRHNLAALSRP